MILRLFIAACITAVSLPASAQFSKPRREYVEYLMTTDKPDRNYAVGDSPVIRIEAYKGGNPIDNVTLRYKTGDEMMANDRRFSKI